MLWLNILPVATHAPTTLLLQLLLDCAKAMFLFAKPKPAIGIATVVAIAIASNTWRMNNNNQVKKQFIEW